MIRFPLVLCAIIAFSLPAVAQWNDPSPPVTKPAKKINYPLQPIVIKTSPTAFLWGGIFPLTSEYRVMVEMCGARRQSDQLGISLLGKSAILALIESQQGQQRDYFKVNGFRIQYAHKLYLVSRRRAAPYGFYVAPMISYTHADVALDRYHMTKGAYYSFRNLNYDIIAGVQAGKIKRMTIDIYFGGGYKQNRLFFHYPSTQLIPLDTEDFGILYNSHLNLVFGVNLGYSI